jgi:histidine kinase
MKFWKQLRWKIIGGHMLVVLVGVLTLSFVSEIIRLRTMPTVLQPHLVVLAQAETPAEIEQTIASLVEAFYRDAISRSLLIAALSAIVTGLLTSLFLAREILRPLWQLADSSQRIASGRYNERVSLPASTELALVATSFNQMAEALERVEQQRVALINNVAHELRTPLTGLEGYLEGLMDGLFTGTPETFAQMSQGVRRLHRLVDDLQALSLVEAGQISLHLETFDLIPIIERIVAQLKPQAMAQCLEMVTEHQQPEMPVYADPDRTAQVVVNLVGNAIRYTPDGGRIIVRVGPDNGLARVEVQDNGIGLPAEAIPYLFERFYRVDRSRSRSNSGGSGIGLTIARHLAWAMGGDLTAASPGPGQGSTFTFTLPLAQSSTHLT